MSRRPPTSQPMILEVQAWDERAGWQSPRARRPKTKSLIATSATVSGSRTARVVLTLLVALAALLVAL